MFSPLLEVIISYSGPVIVGTVIALILRGHFASKLQNKIRGYQVDIVKSHARILELEEMNDKLEKRLEEVAGSFSRDKILLN